MIEYVTIACIFLNGIPIIGLTGNKCLPAGERTKLKGRLWPAFFIWNDLIIGDPSLCFGRGTFCPAPEQTGPSELLLISDLCNSHRLPLRSTRVKEKYYVHLARGSFTCG